MAIIKQQPIELDGDKLSNQKFQDEVFTALTSLGIKTPAASFQQPKDTENTVLFSSGQHNAFSCKINDYIDAVSGASIGVEVSFKVATVQVNNLIFKKVVNISSTGKIVFTGCRFYSDVILEDGSKAMFNSCYFVGSASVKNAGSNVNVYLAQCSKDSGVHTNVTVISEI